MARDELLEQLRQPLLDRVDRRLAVILAVSISAHLAIAIVGWLGDPEVRGWLPGDLPQPAFSTEALDMLTLPEPPTGDAAGVAVAVAPAPAAPKVTPPKPGPPRHRGTAPPARIDPAALVADLAGDEPSFRDASRRVGRDLQDQIDDARAAAQRAQVGKDGVAGGEAIGEDDGPAVADVDGPTRTAKAPEASPPVVKRDPRTIYEPTYDLSKFLAGAKMRALQRCYEQSDSLRDGEDARVHLEISLTADGRAAGAKATGPDDLAACVEDRASAWSFPIELPSRSTFGLTMVFVPR